MNRETVVIRGVAHWAKVLGAPRLNKFNGDKEWSIDLTPDADGLKELKRVGLTDRLRDPKDGDSRKEKYVSFRQKELRKDGTPNDPIRIVDARNRPWGNDLIGNGSVVEVKFQAVDYGPGKKMGMYIRAIRVLELVKYATEEFAPLSEDDEFFAAEDEKTNEDTVEAELKRMDAESDDLDDDVPM